MARPNKGAGKESGKGNHNEVSGLHELPSGLIHTSDSNANAPRGMFVDRFGPPGDPTRYHPMGSKDKPKNFGNQPALLKGLAGNKRRGME